MNANVYMYRKKANMGKNYASSVLAKELGITQFLDPNSPKPNPLEDSPYHWAIILNWGVSKAPVWAELDHG
jgi:hypothetical protein